MATILSTDVMFATVKQRGNTLATLRLSGMSSLADIINYIKTIVKGRMGLLTLSLRNSTQGWAQERNIILEPRRVPTQLTLF